MQPTLYVLTWARPSAIPGEHRAPEVWGPGTASAILDYWNEHGWQNYDAWAFRDRIMNWIGAGPDAGTLDDDEILQALCARWGPEHCTLQVLDSRCT